MRKVSRMTIAMLVEALSGKVAVSTSPLHEIYVEEYFKDKKKTKKKKIERPREPISQEFLDMFSNPNDPALIDATPFRNTDVDVVRKELRAMGLDDCGDEIMYSGITGEPLKTLIFFGPVFYQKLKHMVVDKIHSRARGPKSAIFRQPLAGRGQHGGLKIGRYCLSLDKSRG